MMHRNDGLKSAQPKSYRWQIPPTPEFCHARPLFLGTAECVAKLKQLGLLHMIGSGPPRSLHPSGVQDGMDSELRIRRSHHSQVPCEGRTVSFPDCFSFRLQELSPQIGYYLTDLRPCVCHVYAYAYARHCAG